MSFGKRTTATPTAAPARPHSRASAARPVARPGWWSTYLLALLAATTAHLVVALVVAAYASLRADYEFAHIFVNTAAAVISLMIVLVPVFAVVGGLLRAFGMTNRWIYVTAVTSAAVAFLSSLYALISQSFDFWTALLVVPSMLAGALVLGRSLRPKT